MTLYKSLNENENIHLLQVKEKRKSQHLNWSAKKPKYIRGTNCATAGLKEVVHSPFEKVKIVSKITFHI